MPYSASGRKNAVRRRLLDGLSDAAGRQGTQDGLQPIEQCAELLVLVIGNFMPTSSRPLWIRNNVGGGDRGTLDDAVFQEVPVPIDLLHRPGAVHFDSNLRPYWDAKIVGPRQTNHVRCRLHDWRYL